MRISQQAPRDGADVILGEGMVHHKGRLLYLEPSLDERLWSRLLDDPWPVIVLEADTHVRFSRICEKAVEGRSTNAFIRQHLRWRRSASIGDLRTSAVCGSCTKDRRARRYGRPA